MQMPRCSFPDAKTAHVNYEASHEIDLQNTKNATTLFSHPNSLITQGQEENNSLRNRKAGHKGKHKCGKRFSYGTYHPRN